MLAGVTRLLRRSLSTIMQHGVEAKKAKLNLVVGYIFGPKQPLDIALSFPGKYRDRDTTAVPVRTLNAEDGVAVLLAELDKQFQEKTIDSAYEACREFDSCPPDRTIPDFIQCFQQRSSAVRKN